MQRVSTECAAVDHEPIHVKRHSPGGEVHTGLAAPSGPRERTAVDVSMLRVADGVVPALNTDNTSDAAPVNPIIMLSNPNAVDADPNTSSTASSFLIQGSFLWSRSLLTGPLTRGAYGRVGAEA